MASAVRCLPAAPVRGTTCWLLEAAEVLPLAEAWLEGPGSAVPFARLLGFSVAAAAACTAAATASCPPGAAVPLALTCLPRARDGACCSLVADWLSTSAATAACACLLCMNWEVWRPIHAACAIQVAPQLAVCAGLNNHLPSCLMLRVAQIPHPPCCWTRSRFSSCSEGLDPSEARDSHRRPLVIYRSPKHIAAG